MIVVVGAVFDHTVSWSQSILLVLRE